MLANKEGSKRFKKKNRQVHQFWTFKEKIFVPKKGRAPMIKWYHESLQHAGPERIARTIRQHFEWPGSVEQI